MDQPPMAACVTFWLRSASGRLIELAPGQRYLVGRDAEADIPLGDTLSSRLHCQLQWTNHPRDPAWSVIDLGSSNGTFVNGQRIEVMRQLVDGDVLQVGGEQLTYRLLPPSCDPASLAEGAGAVSAMATFALSAEKLGGAGGPSFAGTLDGPGKLGDLVRFLVSTRKTGRLAFAGGLQRAVWFAEGMPVHACDDAGSGVEALRRLSTTAASGFAFHEGETASRTGIAEPEAALREIWPDAIAQDARVDANDIALAERQQKRLLGRLPQVPGHEFGIFFRGVSGVSGDLYDIGITGDGRVLAVLGDVSGHGVQAALIVAGMLKCVRAARAQTADPVELLCRLNEELADDLASGQFITCLAALVDPVGGRLDVALAGHHPLLIVGPAGVRRCGRRGMAVGFAKGDRFRQSLAIDSVDVAVGETLVAYTDGLIEAQDAAGEEFGADRFAEVLARHAGDGSTQAMVDAAVAEVLAATAEPEDDITVLALSRREAQAARPAAPQPRASGRLDVQGLSSSSTATGRSLLAAMPAANGAERAPGEDPLDGAALGQVVLGCRIGMGSFSTVYRARHALLDIDVAVKVLNEDEDDDQRKRFLLEAKSAARIRHANVVQVLDAGATTDGRTYLVMELVEGQSLARRLDNHARLGLAQFKRIGVGIAQGLAAIHAAGIVHRDLKPDNVLLDAQGVPKITDLGLARVVSDPSVERLTRTGMVVGTPAYIAPEALLDSHGAGPAADIYSLGLTLYHLLTGQLPFAGGTSYEMMAARVRGEHMPLAEAAPHLPRPLIELIERCLTLDARKRPTALEVAEALDRISFAQSGLLARMPAPLAQPAKPRAAASRSHGAVLWVVVAVVLLAIGLVLWQMR